MRNVTLALLMGAGVLAGTVWGFNGHLGRLTDPLTDGSAAHPWLIEDLTDFHAFCQNSAYWDDTTRLMCDLDLSGVVYIQTPIAGSSDTKRFTGTAFTGHFDGNDHVIRNLSLSIYYDYVGLFGLVGTGGSIRHLTVENVDLKGNALIGGLCGNSYGEITHVTVTGRIATHGDFFGGRIGGLCDMVGPEGKLSNCTAAVTVTGGNTLGGLCGWNAGTIEHCASRGRAICQYEPTGGLCGYNSGMIFNSYSDTAVTGSYFFTGGFCGENTGLLSGCRAGGTVAGDDGVGGFCGVNWYNNGLSGTIEDCYASGAVTGNDTVGGFCGQNSTTIARCYAAGPVTGITAVNGFCGNGSMGSISSSFWDVETTGFGTAGDNNFGSLGKTTAQMLTQSTFSGWDFAAVWMMLRDGEDYPRLAWQDVFAGDMAGLYGVDMTDMAHLARYWGLNDCGGADDCGRADVDGSGNVGLDDLAIIAENWLLK